MKGHRFGPLFANFPCWGFGREGTAVMTEAERQRQIGELRALQYSNPRYISVDLPRAVFPSCTAMTNIRCYGKLRLETQLLLYSYATA